MTTANQELYNRNVDRAAMLRLFEQRLSGKVFYELGGHKIRLNTLLEKNAKARTIWDDIDQELGRTYGNIQGIVSKDLLQLVTEQEAHSRGLLERVLGPIWKTRPADRRIAEEIVLKRPLYADKTLLQGWAGVSVNERKRIELAIRSGLAKGDSEAAIAKVVGQQFGIAQNQAGALVRTSVTSVKAQADHEIYKANEQALRGWQYVAVLDSRTTPICSHRDGRIFPISDTVHLPPAHWHCRSTTVPVVKSFDDLGKLDGVAAIRQRNLKSLSPEQQAYYDGEAYEGTTYQSWLTGQSRDVQLRHLGDTTRLDLFRSGQLTVDKFQVGGRKASLTELRKMTEDPLGVPGDTRRFALAKEKLDTIKLGFARPEELMDDSEAIAALRQYYLLQAGELDGTLSLTNYRGALIHTKRATRSRVLNNPPTEAQLRFNPITGRYEDVRLYQPNPSTLERSLRLITDEAKLKDEDKAFLTKFVNDLDGSMGVNERAVVADNLRIAFTRFRTNGEAWGNTKAVLNGQMKFDVMNISEYIETQIRKDSDTLKKILQDSFVDPVLGPVQLQHLHDNLLPNIKAKKAWEDDMAPKIARELRGTVLTQALTPAGYSGVLSKAIPLKVWNRLSDRDLDKFFLKFANRLALADGPDRDAVAVSLGRELYTLANYRGTRNEWFNAGSALLEKGAERGLYKLETFGVQKRRMRSKATGQYFGQYLDTFSETLRIVDPRIQRYSKLNREIDLGLRVGFLGEPTLKVRPGYKTYFAKGNYDTGIPITSDSSFGHFPAEFVDEDMARALNWAAQSRYKVDPEMHDFVRKLLYFHDDKGRAKHYDELSEYRQHIAARGDSYERFKAMEWHRNNDTSFANLPFLDHRARIYERGFIGPQSGETFRPFLNTVEAKALTPEGYLNLQDQIGSFLGGLSDTLEGPHNSLSQTGRQKIALRWRNDLIRVGNAARRGKPQDIRDILDSPFVQLVDGEEQGKLFRLAIEMSRINDHVGGDFRNANRINGYRTALALEQDASSSGAQIIALTTRNKQLAELSNVIPTNQKQRLYDEIAARTYQDPRFVELNKRLGLSEKDLRKAAKAQNMVVLYGAGKRTGILNVEKKLAKVLGSDSDTLVVSAADRDKVLGEISARMARYEKIDPDMYDELRRLRNDVKDVFNKGQDPGDAIMEQLYFLDSQTRDLVEKMTRQYGNVVTPNDFSLIASIMSENLRSQVPVLNDFTRFFGRLAEAFLRDANPKEASVDFKYEILRRLFGEPAKRKAEQKFLDLAVVRKLKKALGFKFEPFKTDATALDRRRFITSPYLKEQIQRLPGWDPDGLLHAMLFGVDRVDVEKKWTHVPWVNFDGKVVEQYFTQAFEQKLSYKDSSGKWINNIVMVDQRTSPTFWEELLNEQDKANSISDLMKARTAYAVNGNHSNDAVLVKRFHLWGERSGVQTSTVHDAFFTNVADLMPAKDALRQEYARAAQSDSVKNTLQAMLDRGLPQAQYDAYYEEAVQLGLIPVAGKSKVGGKVLQESDILTPADILQDVPGGFTKNRAWYAVGG